MSLSINPIGRPGLTVSLADLYKRGAYQDIFSGDAITNHLVEEYVNVMRVQFLKRNSCSPRA